MLKVVPEWLGDTEEKAEDIKDDLDVRALHVNSSQLNSTSINSTSNISGTTYFPYYQHSVHVAASFILAYLFIFLLCMVGNVLVCLIVLRDRHMRTVTNLFILNLAVSDLLVGIFCIPTTLVDNLITGWPFSNTVCKMSGLVQGMSVSASVFTLVAIAVDRFRCIVYPFQPKLTLVVAKATIVMIWVLAMVIMCPSAVTLTVKQVEDHYMVQNEDYHITYPLYTCFENWPDSEMRKVYTTVLFAHIYLAPLTLITLMYSRIGIKLYTTSVQSGMENLETAPAVSNQEGRPVISQKKIKVIKMLIVVALLFLLSWLPLWTLMLLTDYGGLKGEQLELLTGYFFPFAHWLAFSNSSVNPIIYGYFNENFKKGFQAFCRHYTCPCCRRQERGERNTREGVAGGGAIREAPTSSNLLTLGARNRVHTDGESVCLELEWRRNDSMGSSLCTEKGLSEAGAGVGSIPNKRGFHMEGIERTTAVGTGVGQAWEA